MSTCKRSGVIWWGILSVRREHGIWYGNLGRGWQTKCPSGVVALVHVELLVGNRTRAMTAGSSSIYHAISAQSYSQIIRVREGKWMDTFQNWHLFCSWTAEWYTCKWPGAKSVVNKRLCWPKWLNLTYKRLNEGLNTNELNTLSLVFKHLL